MELALAFILAIAAFGWWFPSSVAFFWRDPLGAMGVLAALLALVSWAVPFCGLFLGSFYFCEQPFTPERLPAVGTLFALAVILLLLRRR